MSELKTFDSQRIYWDVEQVERVAGDIADLHLDDNLFCIKSEVDEVITRQKEKLIEQITLRVWAELQLRHNKYKRCLNNAESCQYKSWFYYEKHYEDKARKMWKWQHRWLDLAKLFNPNN